jgi:serine/threonine protein kinase
LYQRYAVKHVRYSLAENLPKFEKAAVDLALEAHLLQALDHPNIISLRGWSRHGTNSFIGGSPSDYFLVMDCLPEVLEDRFFSWRQQFRTYQAKLTSRTRWRRSPVSVVATWLSGRQSTTSSTTSRRDKKYKVRLHDLMLERLRVAHDIACGIEYMHDRRIMHRDIKSSNIGFDADGVAQIFDLGLARILPPESERLHDGYTMSRVGTRSNMAPEVADKRPYNFKADVYSFGIVLWEILSLCTAGEYFRMLKRKEMAQKAENKASSAPSQLHPLPSADTSSSGAPPPTVATSLSPSPSVKAKAECVLPICPCWSEPLQYLVASCLSRDASRRPTVSEVRHAIHRELEAGGYEFASPTHPRRRRSTFRLDMSAAASGENVGLGAAGTRDALLSLDMAAAAKVVAAMVNRGGKVSDDESSTAFANTLSCTLGS